MLTKKQNMPALIYLVDDEPLLLEMLRSYLSGSKKGWKVEAFSSPSLAIKAAAENHPDIVVTDFSMPEMTGPAMLEQIRLEAPNTIRILVSGYADPKVMGNKLSSAHQYLSKPYSLPDIEFKIDKALSSLDHFQNNAIRSTILSLRTLPAVPRIYYELLSALEDPTRSYVDVVEILTRDATISAKILQMVNSPLFGDIRNQRPIIDLLQAITILGTERIKAAVLSHQQFVNYTAIPTYLLPANLSSHRWETASLAFQMAVKMGLSQDQASDAYVAGLMHDMGRLVLLDNFASTYDTVCQRAFVEKKPLTLIEEETFKMTQSDVIGFLVALWGMRDRISRALVYQEKPWEAPESDAVETATAVYLAHMNAHNLHLSEKFVQPEFNIDFLERKHLMHFLDKNLLRKEKIGH